MEVLSVIYLLFIFVSLYFSIFFLMIFFRHRESMFDVEINEKLPSLSVLIPAFNEESTIQGTIKAVLDSDYPKDLLEVLVIDDGSKDKTFERAKEMGVNVLSKENSGKADSLNRALKIAKGEFIAVIDADSYPSEDSFKKMISQFSEKTGAVTSCVLVKEPKNLLENAGY